MFFIIWPMKENIQIFQRFHFIFVSEILFCVKNRYVHIIISILHNFSSIHPFSNLFSNCRIEAPVKKDHYNLFRCIVVVIILSSFQWAYATNKFASIDMIASIEPVFFGCLPLSFQRQNIAAKKKKCKKKVRILIPQVYWGY